MLIYRGGFSLGVPGKYLGIVMLIRCRVRRADTEALGHLGTLFLTKNLKNLTLTTSPTTYSVPHSEYVNRVCKQSM